MRIQWSWDAWRDAGQEDDDLALDVESGEIVILQFRNSKAIAGKDHRCFHTRRVEHAQREQDIGSELDTLLFAVTYDRQARLAFVESSRHQLHRLQVFAANARLQPGLFELVGDVVRG